MHKSQNGINNEIVNHYHQNHKQQLVHVPWFDEYLKWANHHVPTITMDNKQLLEAAIANSDNRSPTIVVSDNAQSLTADREEISFDSLLLCDDLLAIAKRWVDAA